MKTNYILLLATVLFLGLIASAQEQKAFTEYTKEEQRNILVNTFRSKCNMDKSGDHCFVLGLAYLNGKWPSEDVDVAPISVSLVNAEANLSRGCQFDNFWSCAELFKLYKTVPPEDEIDLFIAEMQAKKSCFENAHILSCIQSSTMYANEGFPNYDLELASALSEKACSLGEVLGCELVASMTDAQMAIEAVQNLEHRIELLEQLQKTFE